LAPCLDFGNENGQPARRGKGAPPFRAARVQLPLGEIIEYPVHERFGQ